MNKIYRSILLALLVSLAGAQTAIPNKDMWIANGTVNSLAVDNDYTYIGGRFTYVGPNTGYGAKITTGNVQYDKNMPLVNGAIRCVVPDGQNGWYIGGDFTMVGSTLRNYIARINSDGTVSAWNPGLNGIVCAIARSGSDIYVGGDFTSIGALTRNRIA